MKDSVSMNPLICKKKGWKFYFYRRTGEKKKKKTFKNYNRLVFLKFKFKTSWR